MIDNCADDWRIAMTFRRMAQIAIELLICAVHPIPGNYSFMWGTKRPNHDNDYCEREVSIDVPLSLPMFLRLYLICRVMLLHSKVSKSIITDWSSRNGMTFKMSLRQFDMMSAKRYTKMSLILYSVVWSLGGLCLVFYIF